MNKCLKCGEKCKSKFCNKSCAASYNNKLSPKRKKSRICKRCPTKIISNRTYCNLCYGKKITSYDSRTLDECVGSRGDANRYGNIRFRARKITKDRPQKCINCKYDKHVETCHIKPIGQFPGNAKLVQINSPKNLVLLCKNCHWEFDHGLLKL